MSPQGIANHAALFFLADQDLPRLLLVGLTQIIPTLIADEPLQVDALGGRELLHDVEDREARTVLVGEPHGVVEGVPGLFRKVRGEDKNFLICGIIGCNSPFFPIPCACLGISYSLSAFFTK